MNIDGIKSEEYRAAVQLAMESKTWYLTVPFFFGRAVISLRSGPSLARSTIASRSKSTAPAMPTPF